MGRLRRGSPLLLVLSLLAPGAAGEEPPPSSTTVTLTLTEALRTALENNLDLANAGLETEKSEKEKNIVDREQLPALSLDAGYTRLSIPETSDIPIPGFNLPDSEADLSLTATMPLYTGGRLPAARRQATEELDLTKVAERGTRGDILLETATTFFETLASRKFIEVADEALAGSNRHLTDVSALLAQGQVARVDLYRTELDVAERERDLAVAEANAVRRGEHLSSLIFPARIVSVEAVWEPEDPGEVGSVEEWMALAEETSPEILAARISVELARAGVDAARARRWPALGLFGSYGARDEDFSYDAEDTYWNAGLSFTFPVFARGQTVLEIEKAQDTGVQAANSLIQTRRSVRRGIVDAHAGTTLALRVHAAAVKAVTAGEENLRVTTLKYSQGLISNTDVIDAMLSLSRSRFNLIQALKDYYTNRTRLMRLAGTIEEIL